MKSSNRKKRKRKGSTNNVKNRCQNKIANLDAEKRHPRRRRAKTHGTCRRLCQSFSCGENGVKKNRKLFHKQTLPRKLFQKRQSSIRKKIMEKTYKIKPLKWQNIKRAVCVTLIFLGLAICTSDHPNFYVFLGGKLLGIGLAILGYCIYTIEPIKRT